MPIIESGKQFGMDLLGVTGKAVTLVATESPLKQSQAFALMLILTCGGIIFAQKITNLAARIGITLGLIILVAGFFI